MLYYVGTMGGVTIKGVPALVSASGLCGSHSISGSVTFNGTFSNLCQAAVTSATNALVFTNGGSVVIGATLVATCTAGINDYYCDVRTHHPYTAIATPNIKQQTTTNHYSLLTINHFHVLFRMNSVMP